MKTLTLFLLIMSLVGYGQRHTIKPTERIVFARAEWPYGYDTIRQFKGDTNWILKQRIPHEMAMKSVLGFSQFSHDKGGNYSKLHLGVNFNYTNDTICFIYKDEGYMVTARQIIDLLTKPQLNVTDNDSLFEIKNNKGVSILKVYLPLKNSSPAIELNKDMSICPKCHNRMVKHSSNIDIDWYHCDKCGYETEHGIKISW